MADLLRFLRERSLEDERIAEWTLHDLEAGGDVMPELYVARFSPARLRSEARARLRLLELHAAEAAGDSGGATPCLCATAGSDRCSGLGLLARGYLNHEAYDLSWEHL